MGKQEGNLKGLVDLETPDRELEDLIIKEYKGTLFEDQHEIEKNELERRTYKFYRLRLIYLLSFLGQYGKEYSYIVRRSDNGRVLIKQTAINLQDMMN